MQQELQREQQRALSTSMRGGSARIEKSSVIRTVLRLEWEFSKHYFHSARGGRATEVACLQNDLEHLEMSKISQGHFGMPPNLFVSKLVISACPGFSGCGAMVPTFSVKMELFSSNLFCSASHGTIAYVTAPG